MTVGELREKLADVNADLEVVIVNDYGYGEVMTSFGMGVENRAVVHPDFPWDVRKLGDVKPVFVFPETYLQWKAD